jgi:stage II sporulation protein D
MKNIFLFTICFILGHTGVTSAYPLDTPVQIRVSVANDEDRIELSIRGGYRIIATDTGRLLDQGDTFFNRGIEPVANGIRFSGRIFNVDKMDIIPAAEPSIYLNKRLYKGTFRVVKTKQKKLIAVNIVGIEDYLKGVLYHEVSHRWPMEAIKAQAIASRTYALYQIDENSHRHYHIYSDISSQVYNGVYAQRYRTNKAVDDTKGRVLTWKGGLVPAFFHAACGGHTENASNLWKVDMPPLSGTACGYCEHSPYFTWGYDMRLDMLEKNLKASGYMVNRVTSVRASCKNRSGRVDNVVIKGDNFSENIKAKDLRRLIGTALIKSTNLDIVVKDDKVYFTGHGWGHGVGMCQWGAFSMAKKKKTAEEILSHYYPGAEITALK